MRLFIAVNLSDEMKDSLIRMQKALYDRGLPVIGEVELAYLA